MKTKNFTLLVMIFLLTSTLAGQNRAQEFPLQVTFVYPLGTHGIQSPDYSYKFSFNILTGITGSVDGFELAGLLNINRHDISGFQVAGLGNLTSGNAEGLQLGGLFSRCDTLNGAQISGIYGQASEAEGLQVAGIINISNSAESSIAGLVNINNTLQRGIQIAGIYNQTTELKGIQIGLINKTDTISDGLSIGLINLIKRGCYDEFTFSVADYLNMGLSYKLGLKKFYTVYTIGMNYLEDKLWVAGLGVGHLYEVNQRFAIQPEISWYTYLPMDFQRKIRDTFVSHFRVGFIRKLSPSTGISVSPGIYMAWKSNRNIYDDYGYKVSPIGPVFDVKRAGTNNMVEFGFGLGVALHLGM